MKLKSNYSVLTKSSDLRPNRSKSNLICFLPVLYAFLVLSAFTAQTQAREEWRDAKKIVAIGDLHGDYDQYLLILKDNDLIDEQLNWQGGKIHMVQMGDVVDRGPDSLKIMRHLKKLHKQAKKSKGYVHMLLGNHELMNVKDDLRYVHPGEYTALITRKSKDRQMSYLNLVFDSQALRDPDLLNHKEDKLSSLAKRFPLGYVEHRYIWAKKGEFFEWARRNNTVIKINRTLFTHGGISPHEAYLPLKKINSEIKKVLSTDRETSSSILTGDEGPLWYRGLAFNNSDIELEALKKMLAYYDADSIVIAHTPTPGTVIPRFNGLVVMVDVGIAKHYGKRRANLLIEGDKRSVIHRGNKFDLPESTEDLKNFLQNASLLDPIPSPLIKSIKKLKNRF